MKATIATILVAGCSAEKLKTSRKVPPRHPLNRLARLQKFGFAFNDEHFQSSEKVATTIENFTTNMKNSFERDNCGFYDANSKPHGGPDPNPGKWSLIIFKSLSFIVVWKSRFIWTLIWLIKTKQKIDHSKKKSVRVVAHVTQPTIADDVMQMAMTGCSKHVPVPINPTVLIVSMVSATIKSTTTVMPFSIRCSVNLMMNRLINVMVLMRLHVSGMALWLPYVARKMARPMPDSQMTQREPSSKSQLAWENGLSDTWTIVMVWEKTRCHEREPKICTRNGWPNTKRPKSIPLGSKMPIDTTKL